MRKKTGLIVFAVVVVALMIVAALILPDILPASAVAVTVNGEAIPQAEIDQAALAAELSYQNSIVALREAALPEAEKQEKLAAADAARSEAAVTEKLIRNTLLMQEAKRQGINVSIKDARVEAEKQYALLKQSGNAADIAFVQAFMDEKGWSEKEYLSHAADVYRRMLAVDRLAKKLGADQIDPLADQLTEKAEIVYPNRNNPNPPLDKSRDF